MEDCYKNTHNGNMIESIFLDIKKSFDLVDHEVLITKVEGKSMFLAITQMITSY